MNIEYSKDLSKKVKVISQSSKKDIYEIMDYTITYQCKKGRNIMTCSCFNSTKFCNEGMCYHKLAVIIYLSSIKLDKCLNKLIEDYSLYKENKLTPSVDLFLDELNKVKKL